MCGSVKSHLTFEAFVCPENTVTYSADNGGQKCVLKLLCCRDPALPPLKAICTVGHFPVESAHAHYSLVFTMCSGLKRSYLP